MEPNEIVMIEKLAPSHPELGALWKNHMDLDRKIRALEESLHPGPDSEAEIRRLKKQKLVGKDKIIQILAHASA